jgi:hypothetical protein
MFLLLKDLPGDRVSGILPPGEGQKRWATLSEWVLRERVLSA